jgi:hypothetical protein
MADGVFKKHVICAGSLYFLYLFLGGFEITFPEETEAHLVSQLRERFLVPFSSKDFLKFAYGLV